MVTFFFCKNLRQPDDIFCCKNLANPAQLFLSKALTDCHRQAEENMCKLTIERQENCFSSKQMPHVLTKSNSPPRTQYTN